MEQLAACMACKQAVGKRSCPKCGAFVCDNCFDGSSGVCAYCKLGKRVDRVDSKIS